MATGEKNFVKRVMSNLRKLGVVFQRHEDLYSVGIPDMSFDHPYTTGTGWIEAKSVKEWPKRPTTTLKIKHFTPEQAAWLYKHGSVNHRSWLLIEVERDVFLVPWYQCLYIKRQEWTREDFFHKINFHWTRSINYDKLFWNLGADCYESEKRDH